MKKFLPFLIILIVLFVLLSLMKAGKPQIEKKVEKASIPVVKTLVASTQNYTLPIVTQGILKPKSSVNLIAEVAGKITFVSDSLTNNKEFKKGETLIEIDTSDYQLAIIRAQANVSAQKAQLELEQAKSDLAKADWKKYGKKGQPSALNLNLPQVNSAKAALDGAKADLKLAQRNLEKTQITAPFDGVVLSHSTNIGQFVNAGTQLGLIASSETGEVMVALTDKQLQNSGLDSAQQNAQVLITTDEVKNTQWLGEVVSIEAQRDTKTLLNSALINIPKPLSQQPEKLRFNSFVNVEMQGKTLQNVVLLPREIMLTGNRVPVLNSKSELEFKSVESEHADEKFYYISSGLSPNDEIITTQLPNFKAGRQLQRSSQESSQ